MAIDLRKISEQLFAARGGEQAFQNLEKLAREARKGSNDALEAMVRYMSSGRFDHVREHAASELVELAEEGDPDLTRAFRDGLDDDATCYWCIAGYVKTAGREADKKIVSIALDEDMEIDRRAQAIKCLAVRSRQPFDRGLPEDPGEWELNDLRTKELKAWVASGCPEGGGYEPPARHPALDRPKTKFEKVVAALEKRLARAREESHDPANPSNWLTLADAADLKAVRERWKKLPERYVDFLTRFSPLNVTIVKEARRFANEIRLFGASELIEAQIGYANAANGKPFRTWPAGHVVIATSGADPYVLDLSESDGEEAPVLTAEHGSGRWEFEPVAGSFEKFLRNL